MPLEQTLADSLQKRAQSEQRGVKEQLWVTEGR